MEREGLKGTPLPGEDGYILELHKGLMLLIISNGIRYIHIVYVKVFCLFRDADDVH